MTVRPIIFSAPMVRALLDGRKTMTRRILPAQPAKANEDNVKAGLIYPTDIVWPLGPGHTLVSSRYTGKEAHPEYIKAWLKFAIGDVLWVRETCHNKTSGQTWKSRWVRDADDSECRTFSDREKPGRRAAFHMPRIDSRLTLEVTAVKVERLQDISGEDAEAEGVTCDMSARTFVDHFKQLWNHINGDDAWEANPWVAAITFKTHRCNVDEVGE